MKFQRKMLSLGFLLALLRDKSHLKHQNGQIPHSLDLLQFKVACPKVCPKVGLAKQKTSSVHAPAETISHSQLPPCDMNSPVKSILCLESKGLQPHFYPETFSPRPLACIAPKIADLSPQCASSWQNYLVNT